MSPNKFAPHVYVIPEDRADERLANGFIDHDQVKARQIQVMPPANGWSGVLEKFETEYITYLRNYKAGYVILLVDFDAKYESRRDLFGNAVPDDLKDRVFVIGVKEEPERLTQAMGRSLEEIGLSLADDCHRGTVVAWEHDHLKHNDPDRLRLVKAVKPILFSH